MVVWKAIVTKYVCEDQYGRLILAAQMDRTGADFAVMSGGGIRDSIEAGDISYKTY